MEMRPAVAADLAPLAAGLARLDLMRRYGRDEPKLAAGLARAHRPRRRAAAGGGGSVPAA